MDENSENFEDDDFSGNPSFMLGLLQSDLDNFITAIKSDKPDEFCLYYVNKVMALMEDENLSQSKKIDLAKEFIPQLKPLRSADKKRENFVHIILYRLAAFLNISNNDLKAAIINLDVVCRVAFDLESQILNEKKYKTSSNEEKAKQREYKIVPFAFHAFGCVLAQTRCVSDVKKSCEVFKYAIHYGSKISQGRLKEAELLSDRLLEEEKHKKSETDARQRLVQTQAELEEEKARAAKEKEQQKKFDEEHYQPLRKKVEDALKESSRLTSEKKEQERQIEADRVKKLELEKKLADKEQEIKALNLEARSKPTTIVNNIIQNSDLVSPGGNHTSLPTAVEEPSILSRFWQSIPSMPSFFNSTPAATSSVSEPLVQAQVVNPGVDENGSLNLEKANHDLRL